MPKDIEAKNSQEKDKPFDNTKQPALFVIQDKGDGETVFCDVNDTFLRITGYRKDEIVGKRKVQDILAQPEGDDQDLIRIHQDVVSRAPRTPTSGSIPWESLFRPFRSRLKRKDGKSLKIEGVLVGVRCNQQPTSLGSFCVETTNADIVLKLAERLADGDLVGRKIMHEINNALTGVLTFNKLLQRELTSDVVTPGKLAILRDYAGLVEKTAIRTRDLTKGFFRFRQQEPTRLSRKDLSQIIGAALEALQVSLDLDEVRIISAYDPCLPPVLCDAKRLEQAFLQVLQNAVEAMEGSGEVRIDTLFEPDESHVRVIITDQGPGIRDELGDAIFEPFVTTKTGEDGVGLGLGLFVARMIFKQHGGSIAHQSPESQGAVFVITLPIV